MELTNKICATMVVGFWLSCAATRSMFSPLHRSDASVPDSRPKVHVDHGICSNFDMTAHSTSGQKCVSKRSQAAEGKRSEGKKIRTSPFGFD